MITGTQEEFKKDFSNTRQTNGRENLGKVCSKIKQLLTGKQKRR